MSALEARSYPRPGQETEGLPPTQLYDLDRDPGERHNVVQAHPEIAAKLQSLLTEAISQGRTTPGPKQENHGGTQWEQIWWL